jgi:ribonuclease E
MARTPREPRGEGRRERGERGGRRERRPQDEMAAPPGNVRNEPAVTDAALPSGSFIERPAVDAGYSYFSQPSASVTTQADDAPVTAVDAVAPPESGGDTERAPREKRSRDRYGRDRRERNGGGRPREGVDGTDNPGNNAQAKTDQTVLEPATTAVASAPEAPMQVVAPAQEAPASTPAHTPVTETTAQAAPSGLPPVVAYVLPVETLQGVAQGAGLEWINSDAGRVALAQAAIAATPVAPHVPRTPKPVVLPDDGPLVLVETRRDLKALVLPFDAQSPSV